MRPVVTPTLSSFVADQNKNAFLICASAGTVSVDDDDGVHTACVGSGHALIA